MNDCAHDQLTADVTIYRLDATPQDYMTEMTVKCKQCDRPFYFMGAIGMKPDHLTLCAPIRPLETP